MDFDTIADELYGTDPAQFIASRNAAAKAAKAEGDAALAERVRALRKPTAAAAAINRLARDGSTCLTDLTDLGDRLRAAHADLAAADLRALTRERHELVRAALSAMPDLGDTVARDVEATLEAIIGNPDLAGQALSGRLTSTAVQDGAEWLTLGAPEPSSSPRRRPAKLVEKAEPARPRRAKATDKPGPSPEQPSPEEKERQAQAERAERERARAHREQLRRTAAERVKDRAVAQHDLVRAERAAEQAKSRLEDLRERLTEAEQRADKASADLETARGTYAEAEEAARAAQDAVETLS